MAATDEGDAGSLTSRELQARPAPVGRVVHIHVEDCSEKLLSLQSYAMKRSKQNTPSWRLWMRRAGSLWHKIAGVSNTMKLSTNESAVMSVLDQ